MADQDRWTNERERGGLRGDDDRTRRGYDDDYGRRDGYGADDRERSGGYGGYGAGRYSESYGDYGRSFERRDDNDYETGGGYGAGYGLGDYRYGEGRYGEGAGGRYGGARDGRYGGRWGQGPGEYGATDSRNRPVGAYGSREYGDDRYGGSQGYAGAPGYGVERGGEGWRGPDRHQGHERTWMERAGERIGEFFGGDRREASHRGRGPRNYTRSDDRIRDDVNDRLTDDPWLDASDIEVQVSNCEVTLSGAVESREDKRRAEDLAERVSGVRHVQNNIRVQSSAWGAADSGATTTGGAGAGTAGGGSGSVRRVGAGRRPGSLTTRLPGWAVCGV